MSSSPGTESIKTLLASATALLAPPAPLPSAPPALLERLRASSAVLPAWRTRPGWTEDDELEQIGDDDEASAGRKERRDALVQLVGRRCLDILLAMQAQLAKEFWPAEFKDGMGDKDFLLGTADLRTMRLMLSHAVASLLLPLTLAYVIGLPQRAALDPRLPAAVNDLLSLLETPAPPAGGSHARVAHSTAITLALAHSQLAPLVLAAVTLGWTPTVPPPTHAALRSRFVSALASFAPSQAMSALSAALQTIQAGKRKPPRGWARVWPAYVEGAIGTLLSGQVQRPGGVRAVMENVFGEAGNMAGPEAVEGSKLDQIAGLLSRVPKSVPAEVYIPKLLTTLFDLIAPESASHPMVYTHAASYVVHHLWQTSPLAVEWLRARLHAPWLPQNPLPGVVVSAEQVEAVARSMAQLVLHAPPSPDFTDFVVGPILPPLFALHSKLNPAVGAGSIQKAAAPAPGLAADVRLLLSSWGKVVPQDKGVAGVWSIIVGGRGWPPLDDGEELSWSVKGGRGEIVFGYPDAPQASVSTSMDVDGDGDALQSFELSPDPSALVGLLKSFDRPDVASDIFLKVLDEWRVRANADDQDPLKSLLLLRITLAMMDSLGEKLLADPDHVLAFVEGVLGDEVNALQEKAAEKKPLIQEVDADEPLPELTAEGVEKMGMVETAISLLLASLEANEKLNFTTAPILHPISNHLEALAGSQLSRVRQLAREAQLVLLVRRSTTLTAQDGTVSPTVATYRRALTLVSDPILPVRAHGLVLLRDLVLSKDYDTALTPSILDVYMQAIQDKDSYIYLNAVKGVAAMAETLGKDIFKTLVRLYREGGDGVSGDALDKALRIGEALGLVIRRAGKAFVANAGIVVPVLLSTFANAKLPVILRTSALSLLSTCAEVDHLALLPWADELASAAVDLVQIESVASSPFRPETAAQPEPTRKVVLIDDEEPEEEAPKETGPRIVDDEPTAQDSKHPALRRAAVVFLGLLVASLIEAAGEGDAAAAAPGEFQLRLPNSGSSITPARAAPRPSPPSLAEPVLERAGTVLRYVAHTDDDEVVRGQASEVVALVERLRVVRLTDRISSSTLL
ncbi:hypothetical protein VHUM_04339 [Vanrija humicola]|uniref:RNA polymerase II assembly factor Rtp1 C-terminal domain-containing protein n=1 Tax=Vanrija humicola TaxID=5417 RepID=A0A7D8YV80_VANHU|nr:hypothetical protein VHUM_04339 [Vanrija humicola]